MLTQFECAIGRKDSQMLLNSIIESKTKLCNNIFFKGLVKNIVSAKFWIPLSRINYAAFILHFSVIKTIVYNIESPLHFDNFTYVSIKINIRFQILNIHINIHFLLAAVSTGNNKDLCMLRKLCFM